MFRYGLKTCTVERAFTDLLRDVKDEEQVLFEALGDYYFENDESFDKLHLPNDCLETLEKYKYDAIHYYDAWNQKDDEEIEF